MKIVQFLTKYIIIFTLSGFNLPAQSGDGTWIIRNAENHRTINLSDKSPDWFFAVAYNVHLPLAPKKLSVLKDSIYRTIQRPGNIRSSTKEKEFSVVVPKVTLDIDGGESFALPNDDYIAVSKDGKIVATQNNQISVFDEDGNLLARKSLRIFSGTSSFEKHFDPRIVYDEPMDRFILIYLLGSTYSTSKVQLAFSKSSDATGEWFHYSFTGNPFNDSTWHDYPSIALCGQYLFITFNTFRNGSVNNSGFKQSVIWQLEKQKGYNNVPAGELTVNILQNIRHNDSLLFAIHPVNDSPDTCMYFLSNHALSTKSDHTFLLLKLRPDTSLSQPEVRLLSSSNPYQLPPDALQKNTDRKLNTNDARIQDSYYSNKSIYFVLNSARTISGSLSPGVYFGQLQDVATNYIEGEYLPDSLETAFASIAPAKDGSVLFCYSYSSSVSFPGISAMHRDKQGNYSKPVNVIEGSDYVPYWGDYNKIHKQPSKTDVYWLSAGYGLNVGTLAGGELATRIARIVLPITTGGGVFPSTAKQIVLYPNPSKNNRMTATFNLKQSQVLKISIYDMSGKLVSNIINDQMPLGTHSVSFSTAPLSSGIYILLIKGLEDVLFTEKFIIE